MNKVDWSSKKDELKLGVAILKDEIDEVVSLMDKISNKSNLISKRNYLDDPIYSLLKSSKRFKDKFKEIFKEEYLPNNYQEVKEIPRSKKRR